MFIIEIDEFYFNQLNDTDHRKEKTEDKATRFETKEDAEKIIQRQSLTSIFKNVNIKKV